MLAASFDQARMLKLLVVELAEMLRDQDIGESKDRVHRRAQFMAHRGQERRFRAGRRLGGLPRLLLRKFRCLDRCDVEDEGIKPTNIVTGNVRQVLRLGESRDTFGIDKFSFERLWFPPQSPLDIRVVLLI